MNRILFGFLFLVMGAGPLKAEWDDDIVHASENFNRVRLLLYLNATQSTFSNPEKGVRAISAALARFEGGDLVNIVKALMRCGASLTAEVEDGESPATYIMERQETLPVQLIELVTMAIRGQISLATCPTLHRRRFSSLGAGAGGLSEEGE